RPENLSCRISVRTSSQYWAKRSAARRARRSPYHNEPSRRCAREMSTPVRPHRPPPEQQRKARWCAESCEVASSALPFRLVVPRPSSLAPEKCCRRRPRDTADTAPRDRNALVFLLDVEPGRTVVNRRRLSKASALRLLA